MSELLIERHNGTWNVWMTLQNHDPIRDAFGFIVGTGVTRDAAVADAVSDLEDALSALQGPPGVIPERQARE